MNINILFIVSKTPGKAAVKRAPSLDSATACATVSGRDAAIGSEEAAALYNLNIMSRGIGNDRNAESRYIIIARSSANGSRTNLSGSTVFTEEDPLGIANHSLSELVKRPKLAWKASLAVALKNVPGNDNSKYT
jgi:prephenate dehydratase